MAKKANGDKSVQWSDSSMALSGGDGRADGGRGDAKVARPIFFSQIFSISPIFHARSKAIAIDLFTFSAVVGPLPPSFRSFSFAHDERVHFCESVGASGGAGEGWWWWTKYDALKSFGR